jgi:hypothetical protein
MNAVLALAGLSLLIPLGFALFGLICNSRLFLVVGFFYVLYLMGGFN